jgi:uncharacterized CHY-type Zn-finger protein
MSDVYMPKPSCSECDVEIEEGTTECPSCRATLITCGRCGSVVSESEYRTEVSMCENCWHDTVNQ